MDLTLFKTDKVDYDEFVAYVELKYGYKLAESKMLRALSKSQKGLWAWQYLRMSPDWLKQIADSRVFDSIVFFENNPDQKKKDKDNVTEAIMVFKPNVIKLANGNLTMSPDSNDVRFARGGSISDDDITIDYSEMAVNVVGPDIWSSMNDEDKADLIDSVKANYEFQKMSLLEDGGRIRRKN